MIQGTYKITSVYIHCTNARKECFTRGIKSYIGLKEAKNSQCDSSISCCPKTKSFTLRGFLPSFPHVHLSPHVKCSYVYQINLYDTKNISFVFLFLNPWFGGSLVKKDKTNIHTNSFIIKDYHFLSSIIMRLFLVSTCVYD